MTVSGAGTVGGGVIGIVVDSNSQMPRDFASRHGIEIVPLTVTVDGTEYQEGVDLDADAFYDNWADGHTPQVETSQPAPGMFVAAYDRLKASGVTEILSIHISEAMSGTINSARLAAGMVDVPITLVDTGTASFGISCCVWAAVDGSQRAQAQTRQQSSQHSAPTGCTRPSSSACRR